MGKYTDMIRGLEADKPGLIENRGLVVSGVSVVYDNGKKGASEGWRCRPEVPKNSLAVYDQNDKYDQSPPYLAELNALESRCPDLVPEYRWRRCIDDSRLFVGLWGKQAAALGWSSGDLFGLHVPPENPHLSYNRLSRHDATGLAWILQGRRVTAMSSTMAAIETETGRILKHRKTSKRDRVN